MSRTHEETKLGKFRDMQVALRLLAYMRPHRRMVAAALCVTLAMTAMELVGPYLFHVAIDWYILPSFSGQISAGATSWGLARVALVFLGSILGSFLLQYMQVRFMQQVGQQTLYDLRKEIFAHLQRLPMSFFDRNPIGRLVTRATTDVDALNDLFASGIVAMMNDLVLMFFMTALLLRWNPFLAAATLSPLPCLFVLTWIFRNQIRRATRQIRTAIARINAFLQEHLSGMAVVQLFNREERARQEFGELSGSLLDGYKSSITAWSYYFPAVEFFVWSGMALLYWIGGRRVIGGSLEIGVLISFMVYAQRFFRPIEDFSEKIDILQTAMAAAERIFELLDVPVPPLSPVQAGKMPAPRGEIEFRNVWFSYKEGGVPEDEDWVLRDVSFRVEAGETVAIVGHTGAGKTTVVQLLLRFYEIQKGQILLDGVDTRTIDLHELRSHFGMVLQDTFLFTGTLESNVRLGTERIDRAGAEQALRKAGLGPLLESQELGIDTPVTERGSTLSMGQRQLVSIARALAHNPPFLILDEPTSSVDTNTERMIREALDQLRQGRTALVIAHRLSTIQNVHRIVVLHKGRLREQGSHQELLLQRGIYYRLYQLQYTEEQLRHTRASELPGCVVAT